MTSGPLYFFFFFHYIRVSCNFLNLNLSLDHGPLGISLFCVIFSLHVSFPLFFISFFRFINFLCLVPMEIRRGPWISWDWSQKQLWTPLWERAKNWSRALCQYSQLLNHLSSPCLSSLLSVFQFTCHILLCTYTKFSMVCKANLMTLLSVPSALFQLDF